MTDSEFDCKKGQKKRGREKKLFKRNSWIYTEQVKSISCRNLLFVIYSCGQMMFGNWKFYFEAI